MLSRDIDDPWILGAHAPPAPHLGHTKAYLVQQSKVGRDRAATERRCRRRPKLTIL